MDVYILHSAKLNRYYVGVSKNERRRLKQHLQGRSFWTRRANDWQMIYKRKLKNAKAAYELEKRIKKRGVRRYIKCQFSSFDIEEQ